jgi:adenosine deaminase
VIDVARLPKAELHIHIEGSLEPELMFALAQRNGVTLPYADVDAVRRAYVFSDLQSFLDIYYRACAVLVEEADFYELTTAYLQRADAQGVRHAEIFFDPQSHTERGVSMGTMLAGITGALRDGRDQLGMTSGLIMCFLRHLPEADALRTLDDALPYREHLLGVGLDSSERGYPPAGFARVFERARAEGLRAVAHAGEEGPPEYIWDALVVRGAERLDHGVRGLEAGRLVRRLEEDQVPLTVCPFPNVRLRGFETLADHPVRRMLELGLLVTVNSDDPAYFGGYVGDNFEGIRAALDMSDEQLAQCARNSFDASFLDEAHRAACLAELDASV